MKPILYLIGRVLRKTSNTLLKLGEKHYFYDEVVSRDRLVKELCERMRNGEKWESAITDTRTLEHGERIPEYTFVYDMIRKLNPAEILDVGCVLNNRSFDALIPAACKVAFLNPASEPIARDQAVYYKQPLENASHLQFPLVTCLSTLEHIGFDNTRYGSQSRDLGWDWPQCIASICESVEKLAQLVAPQGTLIVSCPFGKKEFVRLPPKSGARVWQVTHKEHIVALRKLPALQGARIYLLKVGPQGWREVGIDEEFSSFGTVVPGASGVMILLWNRP